MNYEQLAELWKSQPDVPVPVDEDVMQALRDGCRSEDRRLVWLNFQEVIPAVGLFLFFGAGGFTVKSGNWAFFAAALLCLGVGVFLIGSTLRQRRRDSKFGDSVREQLQRSLSQVQHREWLYQNILWWYLLPIVLSWAAIVYVSGLAAGFSTFLLVYVALSLAFFAWVYRLNRRLAADRYTTRRLQLESMLRAMDSSPG